MNKLQMIPLIFALIFSSACSSETAARCALSRPPVALFPTNSTPTSVVVSPFAPDTLLVALWMAGEVVEVPVTFTGDDAQGEVRPFITEMGNPQSLLLTGDGAVLVSDFSRGTVYRVYRP